MNDFFTCYLNLNSDVNAYASCVDASIASCASNCSLDLPSTPSLCTLSNGGMCDCANLRPSSSYASARGSAWTEVWWAEGEPRCLHVFHPTRFLPGPEPSPSLLHVRCGTTNLSDAGFGSTDSDLLWAATVYASNVLALTSPSHRCWLLGKDAIANASQPQPCDDSADLSYVQTVLDYMAARPLYFDANRTFIEGGVGRRQPLDSYALDDAGFAALATFCFASSLDGFFQGDAGLALPSNGLMPGLQGACSQSSYATYYTQCLAMEPCGTCEFWPGWPCWSSERVVTVCNAKGGGMAWHDTADHMYAAAAAEGHNAQ
ncbi:MAG: hypothetical protein SGPRY_004964, partial [Prymnesium sp.]